MKVDVVNQNYRNSVGIRQQAAKRQAQASSAQQRSQYATPAFTGGALTNIQKKFLSYFPKSERVLYNKMNKVADFIQGEMGGIIITGIGTGLVAPWPIAFNPLVKAKPGATEEEKKEVENTKKYTAMRQIVSAILAILIQGGVQKPIDKFLLSLTNDPETAKWFSNIYNQSSFQDAKYITAQVKKEIKKGTTDWKSVMVDGEPAKTKEAAIAQLVKNRKNEQVENLIKAIKDNGVIPTGSVNLENEKFAQILNEKIDDYIDFAKSSKIDDTKIGCYVKRGRELIDNEAYLRKVLGDDALNTLEKVTVDDAEQISPKALKEYLIMQKETAPNAETKQILSELINDSDNTRESFCRRTLERIDSDKAACKDGKYTMDGYYDYLMKKNNALEAKANEFEALKIKDLKEATPQKIKQIIGKLAEVCHFDKNDDSARRIFCRTGVFDPRNTEEIIPKICNDLVSAYKDFAGHKFKMFKQMTKVLVGVGVTLPISCTALNWIYPRFMDICFPSLAGKKTEKVAQNPQPENKGGVA